jgi:metal-dependent amidase/aminoacylase/carboxypeptidase family protein
VPGHDGVDGLAVDAIVAWHVVAPMPAGVAKIRPGLAMSEAQIVRITFTGAGGHAARGGPSVLTSVAKLLGSLGTVVSGLEHDGSSCACTAGVVRGGTAFNVVPAEAMFEGSLHTFTGTQAGEALVPLRDLVAEAAAESAVDGSVEVTGRGRSRRTQRCDGEGRRGDWDRCVGRGTAHRPDKSIAVDAELRWKVSS